MPRAEVPDEDSSGNAIDRNRAFNGDVAPAGAGILLGSSSIDRPREGDAVVDGISIRHRSVPSNGNATELAPPESRSLGQYRTVMAIGAHPDDVEIGCGGSIVAAKRAGAQVHSVAFSRCADDTPFDDGGREQEFAEASAILGAKPHLFDVRDREFPENRRQIMTDLERLQEEIRPDLVFLPSLDDPHQDHNAIAYAVVRTFRRKETLLQYEILRHGSHTFTPTLFVDITNTLGTKLQALKAYRSQMNLRPYFDESSFRSLARTRGAQSGCEFAEGFMVQMMYM